MLAFASVCGKVGYYTQPQSGRAESADQLVSALLIRNDWIALGAESLAGDYPALRFLAPECLGSVAVVELPPDGETTDLLEQQARALGQRLAYPDGHASDLPGLNYLESKLASISAEIGFGWTGPPPDLALIEPVGCDLEHRSFWSEIPSLAALSRKPSEQAR